jgi:predicted membrane metal-binding protein
VKGRIKAAVEKIGHTAAVITDWLLIGSGLLLFCVAAVRVNVPLAKWFLLGCGLFFSGAGCWFRQRRRKKTEELP